MDSGSGAAASHTHSDRAPHGARRHWADEFLEEEEADEDPADMPYRPVPLSMAQKPYGADRSASPLGRSQSPDAQSDTTEAGDERMLDMVRNERVLGPASSTATGERAVLLRAAMSSPPSFGGEEAHAGGAACREHKPPPSLQEWTGQAGSSPSPTQQRVQGVTPPPASNDAKSDVRPSVSEPLASLADRVADSVGDSDDFGLGVGVNESGMLLSSAYTCLLQIFVTSASGLGRIDESGADGQGCAPNAYVQFTLPAACQTGCTPVVPSSGNPHWDYTHVCPPAPSPYPRLAQHTVSSMSFDARHFAEHRPARPPSPPVHIDHHLLQTVTIAWPPADDSILLDVWHEIGVLPIAAAFVLVPLDSGLGIFPTSLLRCVFDRKHLR